MAIKNFLFLVLTLSLISCQTAQKQRPSSKPSEKPPVTSPNQPSTPVPSPEGSTTPDKKLKPVGIFLGPGGIRAFAHIGFLRALQKNHIPITAIGGSEWGAVVAAQYAFSQKPNDVEWQLMKLQKNQIPSLGLFERDAKLEDTDSLYSFLNMSFGDKDLDKTAIPFFCPTTDGEQVQFVNRGKAREQLLRCVVLPPFYKSYDRKGTSWVSGAVAQVDWASEMKRLGVEYLIYVDVISRGDILGGIKSNHQTKALWTAVRFISKIEGGLAQSYFEVPNAVTILEFEKRREAVAQGERIGNSIIPELLKAITL